MCGIATQRLNPAAGSRHLGAAGLDFDVDDGGAYSQWQQSSIAMQRQTWRRGRGTWGRRECDYSQAMGLYMHIVTSGAAAQSSSAELAAPRKGGNDALWAALRRHSSVQRGDALGTAAERSKAKQQHTAVIKQQRAAGKGNALWAALRGHGCVQRGDAPCARAAAPPALDRLHARHIVAGAGRQPLLSEGRARGAAERGDLAACVVV